MRTTALVRLLAGFAVVAAAACSVVAGLDELQFVDAADAGTCAEPCPVSGVCVASGCAVGGVCQPQLALENTPCSTSTIPEGSGACDDAGTCVLTCQSPVDCATAGPCTTVACTGHRCVYTKLPDGTPTPDAGTGDCVAHLCVDGEDTTTPDNDAAPPTLSECMPLSCADGVPVSQIFDAGTACGPDGGQHCDDAGACGCTSSTECTLPLTCGGGDNTSYCGCKPQSCAYLERTCGTGSDGCTGMLDCDHDGGVQGTETDVNCGGPLFPDAGTCSTRCNLGQRCKVASDCQQPATGQVFCSSHVSANGTDTVVDDGGVCCDQACAGPCETCNSAGQCVLVGPDVQNTPVCAGKYACNGKGSGSGACGLKNGETCSKASNPPCNTYCTLNGTCY